MRFGEDFPGKERIRQGDLDDAQAGLVAILNGDERLWVWAPTATDIMHAETWLAEHGLGENTVLVVTAAAHKATDRLAAMGCGVVLQGPMFHTEIDPVSRRETRTFAPSVFHEAGIAFAVTSEKGRMGPDRLAYQAGVLMREGLPRAVAMAAVTSEPAASGAWRSDRHLRRRRPRLDGAVRPAIRVGRNQGVARLAGRRTRLRPLQGPRACSACSRGHPVRSGLLVGAVAVLAAGSLAVRA